MSTEALQAFWLASGRLVEQHGERVLMTGDSTEAQSAREIEVVLGLLPPLGPNALVVEPSAGLGRFTTHLAARAGAVEAWDLVPELVEQNRRRCESLPHVRHRTGDARALPVPANVALVFVNWLFMYLADADAEALLLRMASALRPGGAIFVHESCGPEATATPLHSETWLGETYRALYRGRSWYAERLVRAAGPRFASLHEHDLNPVFGHDDATDQRAWLLTVR